MITAVLAGVGVIIALFLLTVFMGAPYVPTLRKNLDQIFTELYPLSERDVVLDIGSGDGVVLRAAAQHGARAIGYEINPVLVVVSRLISRHPLITVQMRNFWKAPFPDDVTVVYTFGDSRDINKMAEIVQQAATKQSRQLAFISHGFRIDGTEPVKTVGAHHLYIIKPLHTAKPQV